jgi:hypothetical protein
MTHCHWIFTEREEKSGFLPYAKNYVEVSLDTRS